MKLLPVMLFEALVVAGMCWGQPVGTWDSAPAQLQLELVAAHGGGATSVRPASLERDAADALSDSVYALPAAGTAALLLSDERDQRRTGESAAWALALTAAATQLLKETINSPRPDHPEQHDGFPSGHTGISFAFARSLAEESDEWGAVAYAWAAGVAWSRVRQGDHDVPQVLAGAALGWWVADQVARERRPGRAMAAQ